MQTRTIGGVTYRIGQPIRRGARIVRLIDAIPERDGASWTVHYQDYEDGGIWSCIVGPMTGNAIAPVTTN